MGSLTRGGATLGTVRIRLAAPFYRAPRTSETIPDSREALAFPPGRAPDGARKVGGKTMFVSGLSGNEIYCLALKGFTAGELTVGNCVNSMGLGGSLSSFGQSLSGGEITAL